MTVKELRVKLEGLPDYKEVFVLDENAQESEELTSVRHFDNSVYLQFNA